MIAQPMRFKGEYVGDLLVDDCDGWLLNEHKWRPLKRARNLGFYVITDIGDWRERYRTKYIHRLIMNAPRGMEVDHINGDTFDNRRSNLRLCTHAENARNLRTSKQGSSRFRGVYWHTCRQNWMARIRNTYLGSFKSETAAALAFDRAADELFGEFRGPRNLPRCEGNQLTLF